MVGCGVSGLVSLMSPDNMRIHMKPGWFCTLLFLVSISACMPGNALGHPVLTSVPDSMIEYTYAAQTVSVQLTDIFLTKAAIVSAAPTTTPTPTLAPTFTPTVSPTPFPLEIKAILQDKCNKPWASLVGPAISPGIDFSLYDKDGCKLPVFSPARKYLAYATLDHQDSQDVWIDSVKVLEINTERVQNVHFAHNLNNIKKLEWSQAGQLLIWEKAWEGPLFVFVYDPVSQKIVGKTRLQWNGEIVWNPDHTAFYASNSGDYGASVCVWELGGYDFRSNQPVPDLYRYYGLKIEDNAPYGIPYGQYDNLQISPHGWSDDGKTLWVTVAILKYVDPGYYEIGPMQAGKFVFSENGARFVVLAADKGKDFSFEGSPEPRIVSRPYVERTCGK
jgi:hypothetical protein